MTEHADPPRGNDSADDARPAEARVAQFPLRGSQHEASDTVYDSAAAAAHDGAWSNGARVGVLVLVLLAAALAGWLWMRESAPGAVPGAPAAASGPLELASVDVAVVSPRILSRALPLSGSISPVVQATVKAKVGGEVQALTVREGQDVAAGAVIARLDTRNLQAQYDRETAAVDKARADLNLASLNREKNRALLEQRYISQNTFESTESAFAASAASLKLAEAQARMAKLNLDDAEIRAPFAGTVAQRLAQPGEKLSPDSPVVALVDLREMLLEAAVPAAEIPAVRVGQKVRFTVGGFGDRQFEGQVQRISPTTTQGSRAIMVYVAVPNADRALKGGMFAQGELVLESTEPVLAIPHTAVRLEAGVPVVYTLADGRIDRKQVNVGTRLEGNDFVAVRDGLTAGERVILADIGERKPGEQALVRGEEAQR